MSEFALIEQFCLGIGREHPLTKLSVGDDAAIISVPNDKELAVSVDTMVEGVHFYAGTDAGQIAHKLCAVNLSDLASMGATPKWATLALTIPDYNHDWLMAFSKALDQTAKHYGVELIGGDTSRGSLTLSLNIMGLLPKGKALTRASAKVGDDVYVSNTVGDPALALRCIEGDVHIKGMNLEILREQLDRPTPQVELGKGLLNIASACIDVSDGLYGDLMHVANRSGVSIRLDVERLPVSSIYKQYMSLGGNYDLALAGGDDYQLAFSVKRDRRGEIQDLAESSNTKISKIGKVVEKGVVPVNLRFKGQPYQLNEANAYQHFGDQKVVS